MQACAAKIKRKKLASAGIVRNNLGDKHLQAKKPFAPHFAGNSKREPATCGSISSSIAKNEAANDQSISHSLRVAVLLYMTRLLRRTLAQFKLSDKRHHSHELLAQSWHIVSLCRDALGTPWQNSFEADLQSKSRKKSSDAKSIPQGAAKNNSIYKCGLIPKLEHEIIQLIGKMIIPRTTHCRVTTNGC